MIIKGITDNEVIMQDLFGLICGEELGEGIHRRVFVYKPDDNFVVKVETAEGKGANFLENDVWERVCETPFAKWFAKCGSISPCGKFLIQQRTKPANKFPEKIPFFFTDLKLENFGKVGRQFVCHDYALNLLMEKGMSNRMRTTPKYLT